MDLLFSVNVRCKGKLHKISITKKGRLVLHDHPTRRSREEFGLLQMLAGGQGELELCKCLDIYSIWSNYVPKLSRTSESIRSWQQLLTAYPKLKKLPKMLQRYYLFTRFDSIGRRFVSKFLNKLGRRLFSDFSCTDYPEKVLKSKNVEVNKCKFIRNLIVREMTYRGYTVTKPDLSGYVYIRYGYHGVYTNNVSLAFEKDKQISICNGRRPPYFFEFNLKDGLPVNLICDLIELMCLPSTLLTDGRILMAQYSSHERCADVITDKFGKDLMCIYPNNTLIYLVDILKKLEFKTATAAANFTHAISKTYEELKSKDLVHI